MLSALTKSIKVNPSATTVAVHRYASTEGQFTVQDYKLFKLDSGPSTKVTLNRNDALLYYKQMQMIRRFENSAATLYKERHIRGFCHLYNGQEAVAVGMKAALVEGDACITSYRCHPWTYLFGESVRGILCELTGRITGNVHGKGGSMHMYLKNYYGGNGIVGAQQPLGAGVAFAMKYRNQKNVCLALYGDGASNQGQLYEAANMAKLWDLPVLFVCENNGFGMGTSAERSTANPNYYTRGDAVPGIWVDGMDVLAVREATRWAKEYCDAGKGPLFLEVATYRYVGHSMSDPGTGYRTREDVQKVRKLKDCIHGLKDRMVTTGLATEAELKEIDKEVRAEVDEATKKAHTDGVLPAEGLYTDIFHNTEKQFIRGCTSDESLFQPFLTTKDLLKSIGHK